MSEKETEEIKLLLKLIEKAHYAEVDAFGVTYVYIQGEIGGFTLDFDPFVVPDEIVDVLLKKFPDNKQLWEYHCPKKDLERKTQ